MKETTILIMVFGLILFSQCTDNKDEDKGGYDFIDQKLHGKIGGESWTMETGTASELGFEEDKISIRLYSIKSSNPCSEFLNGDMIMFFANSKVGVYPLAFSLSGDGTGQTITLYDKEETMNSIASTGALEITEIDTVNNLVSGRIDARADDDDFVNGNFTVTYCK